MRPSRQQPDLTALPPTQGMAVSPGSSQYFGQADGQDSQMEDAMYAESIPEESPIKENGRGLNLNFLMSKAKTTKGEEWLVVVREAVLTRFKMAYPPKREAPNETANPPSAVGKN